MAQTKIKQKQIVVDSVAVPYASTTWTNSSGNYSTTSTSATYIDQTNGKATLTLKYGKLVRVLLVVEGLWGANSGYPPYFDIGVGGTTTKSNTGELYVGSASYGGSGWTADGGFRGIFVGEFYFVDCGTGSKDFYALWKTANATYAVYAGQYAQHKMYVTELYMQ